MSLIAEKNLYFNRELSWIEFNARVLEEGLDKTNPPLERLKFMSIVSSNFDEFFMIRVAAIKDRIRRGQHQADFSGLTPEEMLHSIAKRSRQIYGKQCACFSNELLPLLAENGLCVIRPMDYDVGIYRWLENYFITQVEPVLTPLSAQVDSNDDVVEEVMFPTVVNLKIHAAFLIVDDLNNERLVIIPVPSNLPRFIRLPIGEKHYYALLDDLIMYFGQRLFSDCSVVERTLFKVTRNADTGVDESRDSDFIMAMEEVVAKRQSSWPVRLAIASDSEVLEAKLAKVFNLKDDDIYPLSAPIDLASFMELANIKGFDNLRFKQKKTIEPFVLSQENTIWDEIRKNDVILQFPYESFSPVCSLVESAAVDPNVLAIKMTLYRTSGESPIIKSLLKAAQMGKQVTVIVELKARFDEERNIAWASMLEQAGAIVVFGIVRLKIHAKAMLVVRREEDGLVRRYAHIGTGNYNDKTAKLYSDLSLFTVNPIICSEIGMFFNMITGLSSVSDLQHIAVSPFNLKTRLISMIERETERTSPESPGLIVAKVNSLGDKDVIDALYKASCAGVKVLLNVRGICQLVPGVKGMSENIKVISIVGRFLEHARMCYFRNGGSEELYLSSADWMTRNLESRIELMFPVHGTAVLNHVYDILMSYFLDNVKARKLDSTGTWTRVKGGENEKKFSAQAYLYDISKKRKEQAIVEERDILPVRRKPSTH